MPPFDSHSSLLNKRLASRALAHKDNSQHVRAHTGLLIVATAMLCLLSTTARAQEPDLIYSYDSPSDEMDFDMPATPDLPQVAPPAPSDPLKEVDRFFSDAPVLDVPEEPKEPTEEVKAEEKKEPPKKKLVRRMPAKPPYNFKTVILPGTIYKKHYNADNRHLPVARYTSDMEHGMLASASRSKIGSMRALKNMGTPVNLRAENGEPIVALAARRGDLNTVRWLLIHGADSGDMSQDGLTALHYAAFRGHADMVELLLSYGADVNLADTRGVTPLTYGVRSGSLQTVDRMMEFGASYDPQAVDLATRAGNQAMVEALHNNSLTTQEASALDSTAIPLAN